MGVLLMTRSKESMARAIEHFAQAAGGWAGGPVRTWKEVGANGRWAAACAGVAARGDSERAALELLLDHFSPKQKPSRGGRAQACIMCDEREAERGLESCRDCLMGALEAFAPGRQLTLGEGTRRFEQDVKRASPQYLARSLRNQAIALPSESLTWLIDSLIAAAAGPKAERMSDD